MLFMSLWKNNVLCESECLNYARIYFAWHDMIAVSQRVHHLPYKSWRCLGFSSSSILLMAIRVWQVPKESWLELLVFFFYFFASWLSAPQWSAQVSHETYWLGIYLFSVFSNRFCVRGKYLKIKYPIAGNGASDPALDVSVPQMMREKSQNKQELFCLPIVLSLFTVYQWNSGLCVAASGEYGNCVSENECFSKQGIMGGPCAEGYGICCVCKHSMHSQPRFFRQINIIFLQSWHRAAESQRKTAPILWIQIIRMHLKKRAVVNWRSWNRIRTSANIESIWSIFQ